MLEVAIALCILGILAGIGLPLLSKLKQFQSTQLTTDHQKQIGKAINAFVLAHKHLPCPAATSNGVALDTCSAETSTGFVPYRTLGIRADAAMDGHHHWMTFAVETSLTNKNIKWINKSGNMDNTFILSKTTPDVNLVLKDGKGEPCIMPPDFVGFMVISHGKSGGYYLNDGSRAQISSADPDKQANTKPAGPFTIKTMRISETDSFDDTIHFVSRNNLCG